MIIVTAVLRVVLLVLYISDIMLNRKMRKNDNTLKRYLTKGQEKMKFAFHFIIMTGLLTPINEIFIFVTLGVLIFFFFYTDKEVYVNYHAMYFRGKYFEFKKIKNFSYVNRTMEFDYENEHVKLVKPFLEEGFIQREIVHRIEKIDSKEKLKQKRNK